MLRYFIEQFAVLFAALLIAGKVLRYLSEFYRIMVVQLLLAFLVLLGGVVIQLLFPNPNNQWLFNTYIVAETALLLYAAALRFPDPKHKFWLAGAYLLFMLSWLLQILWYSFYAFAHLAYALACLELVTVYLVLLYRQVAGTKMAIYKEPLFWICIGNILFFGCGLPYFGFLHFFQRQDQHLNARLYQLVSTLQNLRYLLTGIALLCCRQQAYRQPIPDRCN